MKSTRSSFLAAAALGLAIAVPAAAQDATAPAATATPDAPAAAPAEAPAAPAEAPAATPDAAPEAAADAAPAEPEITVTEHGEWDVGCLAGTTNCEMQQVAQDAEGNPVMLVRVVKLPQGSEAPALAIFNTPLGTLLPAGLGFQIDTAEPAALPFEWCVQEGCIVRLGLRQAEVDALKRGRAVNMQVTSIAEPAAPVKLTLSLAGFTAAFDSLTTPAAQPAASATPAAPAQN